jgi:hypothetical protein
MPAIQTAVGTLSYPHLFKPAARSKAPAVGGVEVPKVYSAVLLFDAKQIKSTAYRILVDAVEDLVRTSFPKGILGKSIRSPFRDCDEKENFPDGYETFISAWSNEKPGVVDNQREDILDSGDVWAGQWARFAVAPFSYENSGNRGVSFYLHHVQIVRSEGLKRLDGRKAAQESFDKEYDEVDEI